MSDTSSYYYTGGEVHYLEYYYDGQDFDNPVKILQSKSIFVTLKNLTDIQYEIPISFNNLKTQDSLYDAFSGPIEYFFPTVSDEIKYSTCTPEEH